MAKAGACLIIAGIFLLAGCGGNEKTAEPAFKSMEQIYQEEGVPVRVRGVTQEPFSSYLKYPALLRARSESTASAGITDVVREIHFSIGDFVKKDAVVLTFSNDNNAYQQAKVSFENAESTFKRSQNLFENKGISQQAYDNAKAGYELAKSSFKAADDMINVKAPISGYLTGIRVQVTGNVGKDDPLFTISNLDVIIGELWISASEIGKILAGSKATVDWEGKTISGRVTRVNQIMDTGKKAFLVLVEFRNSGRLLTSGITADIEIETYRKDKAIVVQRKEMVREGDGYYAFVINNGFAEKRKLVLGPEQGFLFEVASGLSGGEQLITEGIGLVSDGAKVKIVPDHVQPKP